jgi:hypothetical protein
MIRIQKQHFIYALFVLLILGSITYFAFRPTPPKSSPSTPTTTTSTSPTPYSKVCPAFDENQEKSPPEFVCPQSVLAKRRANYTTHYLPGSHFHSQFHEADFVFAEFFNSDDYIGNNFTFIELGGYNGRDGSNSYFFEYFRGWKGILLEASTLNYVALEQNRNNTKLVATFHAGICVEPKLLEIFGGVSLTANLIPNTGFLGDTPHYRSVAPCFRMEDVLKMASHSIGKIKQIDYFSMDVEGAELEIISSHNWIENPVFVVTIEVAAQPGLSGTKEDQHKKRCALFQRGMCRWPFFDTYTPDPKIDPHWDPKYAKNNEVWINPERL